MNTKVPKKVEGEKYLVIRSNVPKDLDYPKYRQYLRYDFCYLCAYCTITESEASSIRFTIDHYEPQNAKPELKNEYDNLMWSCDSCNTRKGDRCPPQSAREDGIRFFRPDKDVFTEHFELLETKISHLTKAAWYTIEALDLNRQGLRRLRDIRKRLYACDEAVLAGIRALTTFQIDRLPTNIRGPALRAIKNIDESQEEIAARLEQILREDARSPFLDEDLDAGKRAIERGENLRELEALHPGVWRGRNSKEKA